jgi:hypothetical protein
VTKMNRSRGTHKLTQNMDGMRNIRSDNNEINKTTKYADIGRDPQVDGVLSVGVGRSCK